MASTASVKLALIAGRPARQASASSTRAPSPLVSGPNSALQRLASGNDLAAVVMAAVAAHMVRPLQLAAVRALGMRLGAQGKMAATHTRPRRRGFSLGNGHGTAPLRSA